MPEGPEIRREADAVAAAVAGRPLIALDLLLPELRPYRAPLLASGVTRVDTHGKAMLTRFACGLTLYSHNQLYGRWLVRPRGEVPDTKRSLRVGLHTAEWSALLYSATDVHVLTPAELATHPFLCRLGPDVLDPTLDWQAIAARLAEPPFRGRTLGALYLDQGFIAGIGNYLRSEILHYARMHPGYRPLDLPPRSRNELARQTRAVALYAYRYKGLAKNPARETSARPLRRRPTPPFRFAVFGRAGAACYRCGSTVLKTSVASRRFYYCPNCQPAPR